MLFVPQPPILLGRGSREEGQGAVRGAGGREGPPVLEEVGVHPVDGERRGLAKLGPDLLVARPEAGLEPPPPPQVGSTAAILPICLEERHSH